MNNPKQILIAPDKFKGSLDAGQVCRAIEEGLGVGGARFEVLAVPMADGGEGTCDMLVRCSGGKKIRCNVLDPHFREISTAYGLSGNGDTAFIEMASASGLQLVPPEKRNPLEGTTYGTGQLIADALNRGVKKIIMGIGGSATNDAGIGMAEALGVRFLSARGEPLKPIGKHLVDIHAIDAGQVHSRLKEVSFTALCDVSNPFYGVHGAAHVFAPQKGADAAAVKLLDDGLRNFAAVVQRQYNIDINFAGAGAGGGLSGGAKVFFNIQFQPGIDFLITYCGLEDMVKHSDAVITGEGKVDEQTLSGKVVKGVAGLAMKYNKPIYVVAGKNELSEKQMHALGVSKVITLLAPDIAEQQAIENAFSILKQRVIQELVPVLL